MWVHDLARHTLSRLTSGWDNLSLTWTPDGKRIVFSSNREGTAHNLIGSLGWALRSV